MGKLDGRRALITGSSSGIGRGVAERFAAEGARVVINYPDDNQQSNAERVVEAISQRDGSAFAVRADVSDETQVSDLVESAINHLGGIDILVNNAGIAPTSLIEDIDTSDWDRVIGVHLKGTFLMTKRVLPLLYEQDYGKIINTASQLAYIGCAGVAHYTAAKGGIISFTRSAALEIGSRNVNINCVAPGATMTPMLEPLPQELLDGVRSNIPKGRIAEVDDIVPTYLFLASDDSSHFQGQVLSPNGGDAFL